MAERLKSILFLFVLCVSVVSGAPFASGSMKKDSCPIKCCKEKKQSAETKRKDAASLCRTLNCTIPAPTSTQSSAQINLAPLLVALKYLPAFQFLFSAPTKNSSQPLFTDAARLKTFQPKYIKNLSLLI